MASVTGAAPCSNGVLSLYLDERRGVQGNSSMRSREFPRVQPEGTPRTEYWYFLYSGI